MRNSLLIAHLSGYVEAMFKDIAYLYRLLHDWERDKARLLHELAIHGERVVTIDLPALAKHFDMCLAKGQYYRNCDLRLGGAKRSSEIPYFCGEIYELIFDKSGKLLDDPSEDAVAALRQLFNGCKKILLPCSPKGIADAVKAFYKVEDDARDPTLNWGGICLFKDRSVALRDLHFADLRGNDDTSSDIEPRWLDTLSAVADRISASFGSLDIEEPDERPKHGPGVTAELKRGVSKYSFSNWPAKLDRVFPFDLYGTSNLGENRRKGLELAYEDCEVPSRLISVPYDMTKPRLIAAEPSFHQWMQQLVRNQLEARLRQTPLWNCVKFNDQTRNQRFALKGSVDGSFHTIDLSSASDRLTCAVVERAFRSNYTILDRLNACRTSWLTAAVEGYGARSVRLRKFAAMGSAVTFPVQSIVYAMVAIAAVLITREWDHRLDDAWLARASEEVSVFGDDIIVPDYASRLTVALLVFLGLQVNTAKTFMEGNFRESCGVDAFRGSDVTPARVKLPDDVATTKNLQSLLESSNNFWEKGWWRTAKWLEDTFTSYQRFIPVVRVGSGHPGLTSFVGTSMAHCKMRWNPRTQQREAKVLTGRSKARHAPTDGDFRIFQYFTERPAPDSKWVSGTIESVVSDMRLGWVSVEIIAANSNVVQFD